MPRSAAQPMLRPTLCVLAMLLVAVTAGTAGAATIQPSSLPVTTVGQPYVVQFIPVLNVNAFYGDEHNREQRDDLGRQLWGDGGKPHQRSNCGERPGPSVAMPQYAA